MTVYSIADYMTGLFESIFMFMLYGTFLKKRESIPFWVYGVSVLALAVLINVSNIVFDYGIMNAVGMTACFFMVSFLYKGNVKTRAVISVLNFLLIAIVETFVLYAIVLIFKIPVQLAVEDEKYRLLGIIISKMLNFTVIDIVRLKFKNKQALRSASYWLLFFVMFSISIIAVFIIFKLSYSIEEEYLYVLSVLSSFGLLFSTFFALLLYEHLTKQTEVIFEQRQREQYLKSQIKHFNEILVNQKQLKKFRHDFGNHLIGLKGCVEGKDYDKALAYIKSFSDELTTGTNIIETGNAALDAVLSTKKALAESKNIKFNAKIQIPQKLPIEPIDLCTVFGNALDNAIEACEKVREGDKTISLTIICQDKRLFCKIENTAPERKNNTFETEKADKSNHGFGIESIKTTLAKYDSTPSFEYENGKFTFKFLVFLNE